MSYSARNNAPGDSSNAAEATLGAQLRLDIVTIMIHPSSSSSFSMGHLLARSNPMPASLAVNRPIGRQPIAAHCVCVSAFPRRRVLSPPLHSARDRGRLDLTSDFFFLSVFVLSLLRSLCGSFRSGAGDNPPSEVHYSPTQGSPRPGIRMAAGEFVCLHPGGLLSGG